MVLAQRAGTAINRLRFLAMGIDRKSKTGLPRRAEGSLGGRAAPERGKDVAKRVLGKLKAPPPHGFPATEPGAPAPDERKPGTRKRGSPDRAEIPDRGTDEGGER